jgi:hypothetical protein
MSLSRFVDTANVVEVIIQDNQILQNPDWCQLTERIVNFLSYSLKERSKVPPVLLQEGEALLRITIKT